MIPWSKLSFFLSAGFFLFPLTLLKAADGDWQHWTEASWNQYLGNGLNVGLGWEGRFENDISSFAYYEIKSTLMWHYSPRWDFGIGYERDERLEPANEVGHTPNLFSVLKISHLPWKPLPFQEWGFSNRFRLDFIVPEDRNTPWTPIFRNNMELKALWRWGYLELNPYIFDEWFIDLDRGNFMENRAGIGIGIPIVSHWAVQLYWMRMDEKINGTWEWHPVIGAQVKLQF